MSKLRRSRSLIVILGLLAILAAGYPRNELADRLIARVIAARIGLPVDCDGARFERRARVVTCERLAIGNPPGFGTEPLATFEGVHIVLGGTFRFGAVVSQFAASRGTLEVNVAADGTNALADATGAGSLPFSAVTGIQIPRLDVTVVDAATGLRHHIREARVSKQLATDFEVDGRVESAAGSGTFDVRLGHSALAFSAHGVDLAVLSPAITPWLGGGSIAGRCDIDLDIAYDRATRRLAVAGEGNVLTPAALLPQITGDAAIGESRIGIRGSLELDLAARRIDARGFRLESELVFLDADGTGDLTSAAGERPLRLNGSVGFDRGAQRYGPLLSRLLGTWGIANATGDVQLQIAPDLDPTVAIPPGALRAVATSDRLALIRSDGRALPVGGASFAGTLAFAPDRIVATDVVLGATYAGLRGSLEWREPLAPTQDLTASLTGDVLTQRLIAPIVGWFGSMPLILNGEGTLALELGGVSPLLHGTVRYDSIDTDVRFDHVRGTDTDHWNFRGMPLALTARFALPLDSADLARSLELEGQVACSKAQVIRDTFDDLTLPFAWNADSIALGPFTAGYFGGRANGRIDVDLPVDGPPAVRAELECANARLEQFVALVATGATGVLAAKYAPLRTKGTNPTTARLRVEGRGFSLSEVMASAVGEGVLDCGAGEITGAPVLDTWLPSSAAGDARSISGMRASFRFEHGVLVSDAAELRAGSRVLRLAGRCAANGILDYAIDPRDWLGPELAARLGTELPADAITIRGPLSEPLLRLPDVDAWSRASETELQRLVADFLAR